MTKQEFYQEADDIVELHKAYGNIIDWDKDECPVKWPDIVSPPKLFLPANSAAEQYCIVQDMRESSIGRMLSETA